MPGQHSGPLRIAARTHAGADDVTAVCRRTPRQRRRSAAPNVELAAAAGLAVDDGVLVDQHLRTSDPDVFAVGDVANAFHPVLGRHIRMEPWANALNQPRVAVRSMLGVEAEYDRLPYFFSDQFDLGMEYSGHIQLGAKTTRVDGDAVVMSATSPGAALLPVLVVGDPG